ncbi:aminotransferase class III-fold pyridoxal phosphate-dependent enzyme [Komagataeibacter medellinensis]|uniref:aminotransferase class III-fold pyridoxal phosphate-dependent enzyme n=1 Tax=Komagataeibacter medellinensis TaxID=1177712 RepID=UPI00225DD0B4|nr:aminotransferase class III-fold pyridoxal phosphate-dependent enzyme [Komagataeibacter medellinensis]
MLLTLRQLADRHGVLLILDEIFTGFGPYRHPVCLRAGSIVPDIITLSKALTAALWRWPPQSRAVMYSSVPVR